MSTKRRARGCSRAATASAPAREPLPVDLLLEIVVCTDGITVVRCAATCRILRRAIVDLAFRRPLALLSATDRRGFDPSLLLGVSFQRRRHIPRVIPTPTPPQIHIRPGTHSLPDSFEPRTSRDGLLLLCRYRSGNLQLRVCNTFTGDVTSLPKIDLSYAPVFLSVGDADHVFSLVWPSLICFSSTRPPQSFFSASATAYELLISGRHLRFRTFSSKHGQWGIIRQASVAEHYQKPKRLFVSRPAVIGRTVFWLCLLKIHGYQYRPDGIVALDVDAAEATTMNLPPGCTSTTTGILPDEDKHLLLASVRGRLSLLVAMRCGISMWTFTPASSPESTATWNWRLVIGRVEFEKQVDLVGSPPPYVIEGFGERSGTVVVRSSNELLRVDLGTKVVTRLHSSRNALVTYPFLFWHEEDLVSLLQAMTYF
ncbi:hypothetical protein CFC21_073747 [Triticum aestivum]|uniref:DUF7595 domain-containing protein n=2 Tax=Triticum aestivum TaxID=4565 RepID=A0A3B6LU12_WHEAT|nr:hypothetical protein CFC21_073747 [Triticum aestivum]